MRTLREMYTEKVAIENDIQAKKALLEKVEKEIKANSYKLNSHSTSVRQNADCCLEEEIIYIPLAKTPELALVVVDEVAYLIYSSYIGEQTVRMTVPGGYAYIKTNMCCACACHSCRQKSAIKLAIEEISELLPSSEVLGGVKFFSFESIWEVKDVINRLLPNWKWVDNSNRLITGN